MKITSVIKYEGPNDILAWKHPDEDFNTHSTLIVNETQEAIFFSNGQIADVFGAGRYILETQNIPLLRRLINIPTGGESTFHCEVYFINLTDKMDMIWGTSSPIQVRDQEFGILIPIGANGQFGVRVKNSQLFAKRLVGTERSFDQRTLARYFRGMLMTKAKDYIAKQLINDRISFIDIQTHLNDLSEGVFKQLQGSFDDYGIELTSFYVADLTTPDDNPSLKKLQEALAKKAEMNVLGTDYQQQRTFDVLEKAAQSGGSGMVGAGIGVSIGASIGGVVGNAMAGAMQNVQSHPTAMQSGNMPPSGGAACKQCGNILPEGAMFCSHCGAKVAVDDGLVVCPQCSERVPAGKFCVKCGSLLSSAHAE